MHLLLAQKGALADDDEAIDLGQTPGDVLFVSAADTELAGLATAHDDGFELRLANQMRLAHPAGSGWRELFFLRFGCDLRDVPRSWRRHGCIGG